MEDAIHLLIHLVKIRYPAFVRQFARLLGIRERHVVCGFQDEESGAGGCEGQGGRGCNKNRRTEFGP